MKSSVLRICVTEGGRTPIDMTFAASLTDLLPRLMPVALRRRLDRRSINLPALASEVRARDYAPGEIFRLVEGMQEVRAWLE
jgi:hypothetical protein